MTSTGPTERDLMWAALILEEKGKVHVAGKRVYLQVNSRVHKDTVEKLVKMFGGGAYPFGMGVVRWQIGGEELLTFLEAVRPHLTESGDAIIHSVKALQARLDGSRKTRTAVVLPDPAPNVEKVDAFNLLEGVDEDQMDLLENQWEMFPASEDGRVVLRAHSRDHSKEWGYALNQRGYSIEIVHDTLVFVTRRQGERRESHA